MGFCNVYYARAIKYCGEQVYPAERLAQIQACANEQVRAEKYSVWLLLKRAVEESFSADFNLVNFKKRLIFELINLFLILR